jgi:hypothetical protein
MQHSKGSPKRKVYSHECIYERDRKISNDPMLHIKLLEKQQAQYKTSRRREIIKIRAEISELDTKKKNTMNQIKYWLFEN